MQQRNGGRQGSQINFTFGKAKFLQTLERGKIRLARNEIDFVCFLIYYIVFCMYLGVSQVCVSMSFKDMMVNYEEQGWSSIWKAKLKRAFDIFLLGRAGSPWQAARDVCIWDLQTQRLMLPRVYLQKLLILEAPLVWPLRRKTRPVMNLYFFWCRGL